MATNGVLSAATPIQDEIETCPHTYALLAAMDKCAGPFALTSEPDALTVRSDDFQAVIPCAPGELLPNIYPDQPVALCDARLTDALGLVAPLVADNAVTLLQASIQLRGMSVLATDREVIAEAWHGVDMPPGLLLPKSAATALAKCGKQLIKFGFSAESITFWFDDGSWLKSQLFTETNLPNVMQYLANQVNIGPIPKGFFDAAEMLAPFSTDGMVYCNDGVMRTDKAETILAANVQVPGAPNKMRFKIENLLFIRKLVTNVDFDGHKDAAIFFGENFRAAVNVLRDVELEDCEVPF